MCILYTHYVIISRAAHIRCVQDKIQTSEDVQATRGDRIKKSYSRLDSFRAHPGGIGYSAVISVTRGDSEISLAQSWLT